MSSFFFSYLKIVFSVSIFVIFIVISFLCTNSAIYSAFQNNNEIPFDETSVNSINNFAWPIPGYTRISSNFGKRSSPTAGASSFHAGIDIPAPEGTNLHAIDEAKVIFASWGAGGGYTITLQLLNYNNITVSYCHVSPIMYVSYGDIVEKNQIIGCVGPKNIYGISNNPYKDSSGNPTNGATTGCHLHLAIKLNNKNVDPLNYFSFTTS